MLLSPPEEMPHLHKSTGAQKHDLDQEPNKSF